MFRAADIPKRLIPATIALGSFTFTMTALPGSPVIQNAIPIPYYGTTVFAAPGLGMIGAVIMFVGGLWWLRSRAAKAALASEGYGHHHEDEPVDEPDGADGAFSRMPLVLVILPLILVVGVNAVFTYLVFPRWDMAFLAARFPDVAPGQYGGPLGADHRPGRGVRCWRFASSRIASRI